MPSPSPRTARGEGSHPARLPDGSWLTVGASKDIHALRERPPRHRPLSGPFFGGNRCRSLRRAQRGGRVRILRACPTGAGSRSARAGIFTPRVNAPTSPPSGGFFAWWKSMPSPSPRYAAEKAFFSARIAKRQGMHYNKIAIERKAVLLWRSLQSFARA